MNKKEGKGIIISVVGFSHRDRWDPAGLPEVKVEVRCVEIWV